jgi:hypothetical protein
MLAEKIQLGVNPIAQLKSLREQIALLQKLEKASKEQINNLLDQSGLEELVIDGVKVNRTITTKAAYSVKESTIITLKVL